MKEVGKIYSAVDADELEAGDLVVCGDNLSDAGDKNKEPCELQRIEGEGVDYRFVAIDEFSYGWALARLVCPKKHAETYKAWKAGAKVEMPHPCYDDKWAQVAKPSWAESDEYRIKPEPKTRRMTLNELAKWLAQGNGQVCNTNTESCSTYIAYYKSENDNVCSPYIRIRSWDEEEWHEPLVEV